MYRYDAFDRRLVRERAAQFRGQVRRYLEGSIGEEEFKALRLRNGLYLQRHAHMLRVAIPYGMLSSTQLRTLAAIAREFDRGYGHFTTRQNIQFNWPALERVPDILDRLAEVDMHAIQTSGNAIRNITSDPLAGVAADEIEDPRPWCELLRQWSTLHPEFSWLPRKFKIAVTGSRVDRVALRLHDIGIRLVRGEGGARGFEILVGGGMGRTPIVGVRLREFLPREHLLSYLEAILRVYNLKGRRDNIHKARIKILVKQLGIEAFRRAVEDEWLRTDREALAIDEREVAALSRHFEPARYDEASAPLPIPLRVTSGGHRSGTALEHWLARNTSAHKRFGYRIVHVPLKAPGAAPGDMTAAQMDGVAAIADRFGFGEVRTTHEQNLVLADVRESDLPAVWRALDALGLATANIGTLGDMICCPGLDFCSLANAGSIDVARQINERFSELHELYEIGELKLKMSGCMNACGHHHVGHIGILGVDKHGQEWYQLTLGGDASDTTTLGDRLGAAIAKHRVAETIDRIVRVYLARREDGERFIDTYRRIGIEPFRETVYAADPKQDARHRSVAA